MIESFSGKIFLFFEHRERPNENLWTFLRNFPSFLFFFPIFLEKTYAPSLLCHSPFPPPQLRTRERTRPCASRTQRVWNSCLHPSPSPAIYWYREFCGWRIVPFFAFTGEGKRGEAFTYKSLMHRFLRPCGEEVKAKNEKRRTRACIRALICCAAYYCRWGEICFVSRSLIHKWNFILMREG